MALDLNRPSLRPAQQRGMAIISALLIAAVVAVIAGGMITRQSVATREMESAQLRAQSNAVLLGAVDWSRQLLQDERRRDALTRLDQRWAQPILTLPVGVRSGVFKGAIEDEQGKFNLSNLVVEGHVSNVEVEVFQRLCDSLGVSAKASAAIIRRVIDGHTLLPDMPDPATASNTFNSGRLTSPGTDQQPTAATQPMLRSLDDVRSVAGVDAASLERLRGFVTLLPATTWVNGNTARAEVLAAQVPGLSLQKARSLVVERDGGHWFINRGDFVSRLGMPQLDVQSVSVGITSDWFLVRGQIERDQRSVSMQALLQRDQDKLPTVIWSRVGA
jgi:general secretion pathway protein K